MVLNHHSKGSVHLKDACDYKLVRLILTSSCFQLELLILVFVFQYSIQNELYSYSLLHLKETKSQSVTSSRMTIVSPGNMTIFFFFLLTLYAQSLFQAVAAFNEEKSTF